MIIEYNLNGSKGIHAGIIDTTCLNIAMCNVEQGYQIAGNGFVMFFSYTQNDCINVLTALRKLISYELEDVDIDGIGSFSLLRE